MCHLNRVAFHFFEQMQQTIPINPDMLRWARVEAGYSLSDAATCARISSPRKKKNEPELTAVDRLADWENGKDTPSLNQLEQLASAYKRPLITFFLPKPPEKIVTVPDFRTLGDRATPADSPKFSALRRKLAILHRELCDLSKDVGITKLPFVGSLSEETPVAEFVENIRHVIGVTAEDQRRVKNSDELLKHLRAAAQKAGIYVLFVGNLGSHHTNVSVDEFRGIAFANDLAPMVVINPNDTKAAQVFTFIHELAHLWLGSSGISSFNALGTSTGDSSKEKLCNRIAAEFLVPEADLMAVWKPCEETLNQAVNTIAKRFKVSGAVIGRRLLDFSIISNDEYSKLLAIYLARWKKTKEGQPKSSGAPKPEILDRFRLGEKTIHTFISAAQAGRIGFQDAARLMNIPVSRFDKVMQ